MIIAQPVTWQIGNEALNFTPENMENILCSFLFHCYMEMTNFMLQVTFGSTSGSWWPAGTDTSNLINVEQSADRKVVSCNIGGEAGHCGVTSSSGELFLTIDGTSIFGSALIMGCTKY